MGNKIQIISLFGPPASGKGTQADFMIADGYFHFSPGKYLREQIALGDPDCLTLKPYMDRGDIAPDTIVIPIIEKMILDKLNAGCTKIVLDGCPRTMEQVRAIDALLAQRGLTMTLVSLVTPRPILEDRRAARVAEMLAAGKTPRNDDNVGIFQHRQDVYLKETAPIAAHYAATGSLKEIDGAGTPAQVYQRLYSALHPPRSNREIDIMNDKKYETYKVDPITPFAVPRTPKILSDIFNPVSMSKKFGRDCAFAAATFAVPASLRLSEDLNILQDPYWYLSGTIAIATTAIAITLGRYMGGAIGMGIDAGYNKLRGSDLLTNHTRKPLAALAGTAAGAFMLASAIMGSNLIDLNVASHTPDPVIVPSLALRPKV